MAKILKVKMTPELLVQFFTVGNTIGPLTVIKGIPEGYKLLDVEMERRDIVFSFIRDVSDYNTEYVDVVLQTATETGFSTMVRPDLGKYINGIFDK